MSALSWTIPFLGLAVLGLAMHLLWRLHLRWNNAGIVDIGWAGGLAFLAALYALLGHGWPQRRAVLAAMGLLWGGRLALHLARRIAGRPEDARYRTMRVEWQRAGYSVRRRFYAFFQAQALVAVLLSLPFFLAAQNPAMSWTTTDLAGIALWAVGFAGEAVADEQMRRFHARNPQTNQVCRYGLWRYSRHPNHFCEWIIWVGFFLFALSAPWGWAGLLSPLLMLFLLLYVTGIPPAEAQALARRGEAYRTYQQTTSAFVPWLSRRSRA